MWVRVSLEKHSGGEMETLTCGPTFIRIEEPCTRRQTPTQNAVKVFRKFCWMKFDEQVQGISERYSPHIQYLNDKCFVWCQTLKQCIVNMYLWRNVHHILVCSLLWTFTTGSASWIANLWLKVSNSKISSILKRTSHPLRASYKVQDVTSCLHWK